MRAERVADSGTSTRVGILMRRVEMATATDNAVCVVYPGRDVGDGRDQLSDVVTAWVARLCAHARVTAVAIATETVTLGQNLHSY